MMIRDLRNEDKPREKLRAKGPKALSDSELLAIVLRTGSRRISVLELASRLLQKYKNIQGLANAQVEELCLFGGLGNAKACSILAVMELSKRLSSTQSTSNLRIRSPKDVFNLVGKDIRFELSEKLILVSLDSRGKFIASDIISTGTISETIINSREIFQKAFTRNASSIILVHNHPSGETEPSQDDITATESVTEAGKKLGIPLLDHIIVTKSDFLSLKQIGAIGTKGKGGDFHESE